MNTKLLENNYLIIPNFISSYKASNLKEEFEKYCELNNIQGDEQSKQSSSNYNYISFLELLCEKTPEVSSILEETVLPTYAYARVYKNQGELSPHTDRDACEISLTLHLGGDKPWPIWIKTPSGEDKSVDLMPGDAMMYFGCTSEHWREKYDGQKYTQVFLHYVRSRGDKFYSYFDKVTDNKEVVEKENSNILNIEVNQKQLLVKPQSKLEDFIEVFEDVLPNDLCDLIIQEYKNSNDWKNSTIDNEGTNSFIRNCSIIPMSDREIIQSNFTIRKKIDDLVFNSVSKSKNLYKEKHKTLNIEVDSGYDLLRYEEGQFYTQHTDSYIKSPRSISCSIQLNDDYDGGEFSFFDREMLIRAKKGSIIMFPSNFMYPHEIMPIIRGTRYSIVTWLI